MKCLLVDDLEENLLALAALLRRPSLEIITARSGVEALELLLAHDFALAFIDVQMPNMDGFELAELMRGTERTRQVPIIFVKTPYNFNFWDVRNRVPADMTAPLTAIKRGYAYVVQNERGHFFSEGNYDILGAPRTDGYDAMEWLSKQPWSNGKVGATGCSSTAEYQPGVTATGHPAFAAMNVQVDVAGREVSASKIDDLGPRGRRGLAHLIDAAARDMHHGVIEDAIWQNHAAAAKDEPGHDSFLLTCNGPDLV